MFNKKRKDQNAEQEQKNVALADRTGEYTPDITDRRRIAVSEVVMFAEMSGGVLMPQMVSTALIHNITEAHEGMDMTRLIMARLAKIAQGGEY
jgi:hypothetical protein